MSTVYELLYENNYPGWSEQLVKYKKAIKNLSDLVQKNEDTYGGYYPEKKNIFKFLTMTPLDKVKVVIWGQDPYPTLLSDKTPRAQGYSFGVRKDDEIPKSLQNIYKEIKSNFSQFEEPDHGDLTWLADQGILFMNSALTYCPKNPKCYLNLWNRFTYIIINIINEKVENCIHILWGKNSEKLNDHITSREIYIAPHPSPLSAYRGFFGCNHFKKINITLKRQEKDQINWNEDPEIPPTYL